MIPKNPTSDNAFGTTPSTKRNTNPQPMRNRVKRMEGQYLEIKVFIFYFFKDF
jgi:hypothetical protein